MNVGRDFTREVYPSAHSARLLSPKPTTNILWEDDPNGASRYSDGGRLY